MGPGEITIWGTGCETKSWTKLELSPLGGGCWIEITMQGDDRQPPELRECRTGAVALDDAETARLIETLSNAALEGRELPLDETLNAGAITISLTGTLAAHIGEQNARRLAAVADVLLDLAERAGLVVSDAFHPLGSMPISKARAASN